MKKYLLIPIFFIAALATANADCGACGGHVHDHDEVKSSCCKSDSKCDKEKSDKAACDKAQKKECCATEEDLNP